MLYSYENGVNVFNTSNKSNTPLEATRQKNLINTLFNCIGGTPLVPDTPAASDQKRLAVSTPVPINASNTTAGSSNGPKEQVRQETWVMQRVSELQRDGMWTEKRLPKLQEPARPKAHWDYLLEEMVWLAADFAQERKWKKAAAKKCARMVQKHFQDKALAAQRAEKAQELQLKRIAGFLAKEIKFFWSNVEKLVEYKQQTKIKEKRKKALDQHLSFIVDQTEKYSQQLAVGMNKQLADTSAAVSLNSSRRSSPKPPSDGKLWDFLCILRPGITTLARLVNIYSVFPSR